MEASDRTVLTLAGSLRRGSLNRRVLDRAAALAPEGVRFEAFERLGEIPHFSQDLEGELTPEPVLEMRRRIESADAVLIATPEYNSAMPGVLKNALDWASRPSGESVFDGKPVAAVGASPGRYGAVRAQADVRRVLEAIGAEVLERELPIPRAHEGFDDSGALSDPAVDGGLADHVAALIDLIKAPAPTEHDPLADYSLQCQRLGRAA